MFDNRASVEIVWVHRPLARAEDPAPLLDAVRALTFTETGDGYAWTAGYWKRGAVSIHETHND